jgi:hypothetical protein
MTKRATATLDNNFLSTFTRIKNFIAKYWSLVLSCSLLIVTWSIIFPYYKYLIDADAVGYLTVAKRMAAGDWYKATNGLWSPMASFLLVPFIKQGYDAFTCALLINLVTAVGVLIVWFKLAQQFISQFALHILTLAFSIALVYYSYLQVFADLLQVALLLIFLLITTRNNFESSIKLHVLAGLITGIAFYAKAYSFPFLIFYFVAISLFNLYNKKPLNLWPKLIALITCVIIMLPWSVQLSKKYGGVNISGNSGKLNMSWYINRGKTFKPDIKYLIPPTYGDSPSFWEDPYPSQGKLDGPFSSAKHLFIKWPMRIAHTCLMAILCFSQISIVILIGLLYTIYLLFKRKIEINVYLLAACIAITCGYLLVHIEARYVWLAGFVGTIIAIQLGSKNLTTNKQKRLSYLLAISIVIYPIFDLTQLYNKGKENFELARLFTQLNIKHKKFAGNSVDAGKLWVAAYLSQNQNYTIEHFDYTSKQLQDELLRYNIAYYTLEHAEKVALPICDKIDFINVGSTSNFTLFKLVAKQ